MGKLDISKFEVLSGHLSPETAYIVNDYPYGFRLRCKIRYWMEHDAKKGSRFCSQTSNPKRDNLTWNKPKKSTYCYVGGVMTKDISGTDTDGHIHWEGLSEYSSAKDAIDFKTRFSPGLPDYMLERLDRWIKAKGIFEQKLADGTIYFTINGERV